MLLLEVIVVLEVLLGEDFPKLVVNGLRVAQRLDRGECAEILEIISVRRTNCLAQGPKGQLLCFFRSDLFLIITIESRDRLQEIVV